MPDDAVRFRKSLSVREATPSDVPLLKRMIEEFARHERLPVARSEAQLLADGFGDAPAFGAFVAFVGDESAGYALFYTSYSSFRGRGVFLEDLYVAERYRGHGIARALLARVAARALQGGAFGVDLNILDWNESARQFFARCGAVELEGRKTYSIDAAMLSDLTAASGGGKFKSR
jgi:GNAT superfamily N-acetyltransferase